MGRPPARYCLRGHEIAVHGRASNGRCRECQRARDRGELKPLRAQRLNFGPIADALAERDINVFGEAFARKYYRWRRDGIPLFSADEVCCHILGRHPVEVYGLAWFDAMDEEEALVD